MSQLAKAIRRARNAAGMTQYALAVASGVSRPTIAHIEMGEERNIRADTLKKLAKALRVPVNELLAPTEDEENDVEVVKLLNTPLAKSLHISAAERQLLIAHCSRWPAGTLTDMAIFHLVSAIRASRDPSE